jgi:hypothetical protein
MSSGARRLLRQNEKRAPEAPDLNQFHNSLIADQKTNSFVFEKPGSGLTEALKNTFSEKAPCSRTKTVARAELP